VQDECIKNIKYDIVDESMYGIFTTFTYENKEYRIVYDYVAKYLSEHDNDDTNGMWRDDYSFIMI
jgi:hypothetical protein